HCGAARAFFFSALFFSQAEDGIRDRNVTGVQTCALPICKMLKRILFGAVLLSCSIIFSGCAGHDEYPFSPASLEKRFGDSMEEEIGRASCRGRGEGWGGASAGCGRRAGGCDGK